MRGEYVKLFDLGMGLADGWRESCASCRRYCGRMSRRWMALTGRFEFQMDRRSSKAAAFSSRLSRPPRRDGNQTLDPQGWVEIAEKDVPDYRFFKATIGF